MKLFRLNSDKKKVFALLFVLMLVVTAVSFVGRVSMEFLDASSVSQPPAIDVQPPAGIYEIESEDDALAVSMLSMIGADIWYTDDGSSPMDWKVLDMDNPNLKHYSGYSILLTKSTIFRIVGITMFGSFTPIQTVLYTIKEKVEEVEIVEKVEEAQVHGVVEEVVNPRSLSTSISRNRPTLEDIRKLRARLSSKEEVVKKVRKRHTRSEILRIAQERRRLNRIQQDGGQ